MQARVERAISEVTGEDARVVASGRTDSGTHALGQVVAFSTSSVLPARILLRAVNAHLPRDIAVTSAADAESGFHPRFDAASRLYRYLIWNRPVRSPLWEGRAAHIAPRLDEQAMDAALQTLVGCHNFGAFIRAAEERDRERSLFRAHAGRQGNVVWIELEGTGFMRHMVRAIAGTVIEVGLGKIDRAGFAGILASRDRRQGGRTAPAHGLYLVDVRYAGADVAAEPELGACAEIRFAEEETR